MWVSVNGRQVSRHGRCWATGRTLTDPEHVTVAKGLCSGFLTPGTPIVAESLARDLAGSDTALGVTLDELFVVA